MYRTLFFTSNRRCLEFNSWHFRNFFNPSPFSLNIKNVEFNLWREKNEQLFENYLYVIRATKNDLF